ncbi:MAG: TIGR01459 family HAD-type hydrolase [Paracoccus sp. (in: a-proteobacteria)]|uniref:TIGR01459 family HAD-type hydrolase n=1 Tax=Paracoccus sp. TaxID=267 RepID=UPI0026E02DEE|nr:TIGR01459 family HAD-type hydrolase [Paracoccus sp. (in: a-proteobacteria)]MDO5622333.1 TIGR01459 family HAD-type hydrolase [Paracoccus sp. (in: a-proteobacteria)]
MARIIGNLAEIGPDYDILFCDLWGCLHNGRQPYPAAVAALQGFRQGGGQVVLLTNAPRPSRFVIESLDRMGVPRDAWDAVVSSGDAAQDAMFAGAVGRRVWHLGPEKDDGFFTDIPAEWQGQADIERVSFEEAEGIICTGPFHEDTETPDDYRARLMLARERGMKLLCANPDIVVDMGEHRIYCAGALAALYEDIGGTSLYFGKPHPPIYDLARRRIDAPEGARILAIGDGINTDVAGAASEGIDSLFITGGLAAAQMGADVENPSEVKLAEFLRIHQLNPTWVMGRLR